MALFLTAIAVLLLLCPGAAHAYLDPGTGSYVLQIVLGLILGAAIAARAFWTRIKSFFASLFSRRHRDQ